MEHSDLSLIGTAIVGFGFILFGIITNVVQLVGIGAMVSIVFSLSKLLYDRRDDRRKKRDEEIQRLLPSIYQPLYSWATKMKQSLEQIGDGYFRFFSAGNLPDLSDNAEYNALVGDTLKNGVTELKKLQRLFDESGRKVAVEYVERMKGIVATVRPDWRYDTVALQVKVPDGTPITAPLGGFLITYDLDSIKFWTSMPNQKLTYGSPEGIPVPDGFDDAARSLDGLPSYGEYKQSKEAFASATEKFLDSLKVILRDGETDWHFS